MGCVPGAGPYLRFAGGPGSSPCFRNLKPSFASVVRGPELSEIAPYRLDVELELPPERGQTVEALLAPQVMDQVHAKRLAVQVAREIE